MRCAITHESRALPFSYYIYTLALKYRFSPCSLSNWHKTHSPAPLKPNRSLRIIGSSQSELMPPKLMGSAQRVHDEDTEGRGTDVWGWLRTQSCISLKYLDQIGGRVQRRIKGTYLTARSVQSYCHQVKVGGKYSHDPIRHTK